MHHDSTKYDGYRLTNMGYDFLAIKVGGRLGFIPVFVVWGSTPHLSVDLAPGSCMFFTPSCHHLQAMLNRGHITAVGRQIGVGKESDIFEVKVVPHIPPPIK